MVQVTQVDIDAGTSIEFRPGGNHIMLVDLARPLVLGDTFVATLRFASGRTLDVSVTVSDNPPSSPQGSGGCVSEPLERPGEPLSVGAGDAGAVVDDAHGDGVGAHGPPQQPSLPLPSCSPVHSFEATSTWFPVGVGSDTTRRDG